MGQNKLIKMINMKSVIKIEYILSLLVILLSGSMLFVGYTVGLYIVTFIFLLFILLRRPVFSKIEFTIFITNTLISISVLIINFIFSTSNEFKNYFTLISFVVLSQIIYIISLNFKQRLSFYLNQVLKHIVMFSLIGFVLIQFLPASELKIGNSNFVVWSVFNFFFFDSSINILGLTVLRNQFFFWEPGVLSVFANIFLFFSLFEFKNRKNAIFASLSIVSTFSTTGIFLLCLQLYSYLRINKLGLKIKSLMTILIVCTSILFITNLMEKKKISDSKVISSLGMRKLDLYSGFMVAVNNPFFGVGINKKAFIKERDKYLPKKFYDKRTLIKNRGNSNSLIQIFYGFGLIIALFILYFFYNQEIINKHKKLFYLIILICISSEPLWVTPFFLILLFSGMRKHIRKFNII